MKNYSSLICLSVFLIAALPQREVKASVNFQIDLPSFANSLAFSPDQTEIAVAMYTRVHIYRVPQLTLIKALDRGEGQPHKIMYSPDGNFILLAYQEKFVSVWDRYTGKHLSNLEHDGIVWDMNFSVDGKYLITAGDGSLIKVWNFEPLYDGKPPVPVVVISGKSIRDRIYKVAFLPNTIHFASIWQQSLEPGQHSSEPGRLISLDADRSFDESIVDPRVERSAGYKKFSGFWTTWNRLGGLIYLRDSTGNWDQTIQSGFVIKDNYLKRISHMTPDEKFFFAGDIYNPLTGWDLESGQVVFRATDSEGNAIGIHTTSHFTEWRSIAFDSHYEYLAASTIDKPKDHTARAKYHLHLWHINPFTKLLKEYGATHILEAILKREIGK